MSKIQMVCGVSCEILEERVEQGIFWGSDETTPLAENYRLVMRPDTGEMLMVWFGSPFMGLDDVVNLKHASSLRKLARQLTWWG